MPHRTKHPLYTDRVPDWKMLRHFLEESKVKDAGTAYLPMTEGMKKTATRGTDRYAAYVKRAVVPDLLPMAQAGLVGIAHRKPAVVTVPSALDSFVNNMTAEGEDIHLLQRRITAEQLLTGRKGLAVNLTDAGDPRVATYSAESIWNWNYEVIEGENRVLLVVLDQTGNRLQADGFSWKEVKQFRVLRWDEEKGFTVQNYREDGPDGNPEAPNAQGTHFDRLPFVFVGAQDLSPDPGPIPLLPTGRLSATIYRGEADYRQTLFEQGQHTLVTKGYGADDPPPTGTGAWIDLATDGDAKMMGIDGQGLPEQRQALENDYKRGEQATAQLLSSEGSPESGQALRQRMAAKTATLTDVVQAGAAALEAVLKMVAQVKGLNPEDVSVEPNLDFAENTGATRELLELMQAKRLGAPVADQSIHRFARDRDLTEENWDEESSLLELEDGGAPPEGE